MFDYEICTQIICTMNTVRYLSLKYQSSQKMSFSQEVHSLKIKVSRFNKNKKKCDECFKANIDKICFQILYLFNVCNYKYENLSSHLENVANSFFYRLTGYDKQKIIFKISKFQIFNKITLVDKKKTWNDFGFGFWNHNSILEKESWFISKLYKVQLKIKKLKNMTFQKISTCY